MTPDLTYLVYTAVLCLLLWVPYIVGVLRKYGGNADDYRDLPSHDLPPFLKRAYRAHINLVENLPVFAVLVLVAHVADKATAATATCAAVFFWARVAHAVVFWFGWPYVRTLAFAVSWFTLLYMAWQLLG